MYVEYTSLVSADRLIRLKNLRPNLQKDSADKWISVAATRRSIEGWRAPASAPCLRLVTQVTGLSRQAHVPWLTFVPRSGGGSGSRSLRATPSGDKTTNTRQWRSSDGGEGTRSTDSGCPLLTDQTNQMRAPSDLTYSKML